MTAQQILLFHTYPWTAGELHIFRKREPLSVSQWAERHRILRVSAHPGPWRNSVTPYLTDIMDTWGLPWVRKVVVCAAVQTGKTEGMYNCLGYSVDRSPGPALIVMPDQEMSRRVSKDRIKPMVEDSRCLRKLLSPDPDDLAKTRIKFRNGMVIYLSWASSPSLMAAMPIEKLFLDELDKFPQFSGDEADPISLGEARTTTYQHTKKIFEVSTPTIETKFIWIELNDCQEIRDYYVPCPECGQFQVMKFDQVRWPEKVEHKKIKRGYLARYECEYCQAHWTDADRDRSVTAGHWVAREPADRPTSVGFHLPAYYSPFVSLSELAAEYIEAEEKAKVGEKAKLMHFYNAFKAEPYTDVQKERQEDEVLKLRDERPRGLVPSGISCLTAAVDTQQRGFYYEIRAWGWGMSLESWQIREGYVESFAGLVKILFEDEYKNAAGNIFKVRFTLMDSGGTYSDFGISRTAQVYDFCRRYRGIFPLKGQQRQASPYKVTQLDTFPGTNKPIPGGLKLYNVHVTYFKDTLHHKLQIEPTDPGAWHLHSEASEDYAKQMCSEFKNEKGLWECPRGKKNHYWDLGVYGLAVAEVLGLKFWKRKSAEPAPQKAAPKLDKQQSRGGSGSRRW